MGISSHALAEGVVGVKALQAILRICRVYVKAGKGSSCNCCHLYVPPGGYKELTAGGF